MKFLSALRDMMFPAATVDLTAEQDALEQADSKAAIERARAIELMKQWSPDKVEDLKRIANRNFVEAYLVPEKRDRNST